MNENEKKDLASWRAEQESLKEGEVKTAEKSLGLKKVMERVEKLRPWEDNACLHKLAELAQQVDGVRGAFVEFGVCPGTTALILSHFALTFKRVLYLFDTFTGMPPPSEVDKGIYRGNDDILAKKTGHDAVAVEDIEEMLNDCSPDVKLVPRKGLFEQTARTVREAERVAFAHIDACWWYSVRDALHHLHPFMMPGGLVVVSGWGVWKSSQVAATQHCQAFGHQIEEKDGLGWWQTK